MVKLKNIQPSRPHHHAPVACHAYWGGAKPRDGGTERQSQHKHDGRSADAPAGAAQCRDPARAPPLYPDTTFGRAAPSVPSTGRAGGRPSASASACASAAAVCWDTLPADEREEAKVRLTTKTLGPSMRVLTAEPAAKAVGAPQVSQNRLIAEYGPTTGAGPACRLMPCRGAEVDMHSIVPPAPVHYHLH